MARALLFLVCVFAALSSSTAEALGVSDERILVFSALVGLLVLVPVVVRPRAVQPSGALIVLFLLLAAMLVLDARGRVDPLDYKLLIPLLIILAAPNLVDGYRDLDLDRFVWRLLSLYVVGTLAYQLVAEPEMVARGYGDVTRYDPTGSVVMHASLGTIHLVLAATRVVARRYPHERLAAALLGGCSLALVLSAATRTALVTLALTGLLSVVVARRRTEALAAAAGAAAAFAVAFAAYTLAWDDSFVARLTGADAADWGSGRGPSIGYWLDTMGDRPLGLGLGAVREALADGKPNLDGALTVEWPHNEFVRLYVEAGPIGLAFVFVLAILLVGRAIRAARRADAPERRMLLLVIAADLIAELCLQNLLNAVYHATVLILILCLAAGQVSAIGGLDRRVGERRGPKARHPRRIGHHPFERGNRLSPPPAASLEP